MVSEKITIKNEQGLHMRPAIVLSKKMSEFTCDTIISFNNSTYNAKSVMMLMTACMKCGSEIEIQCNGEDEEAALKAAIELIEDGFGE